MKDIAELGIRVNITEAKTVTAAGALVHALEFIGVKRIGFASPYVSAINNMAIDFLAEVGVETVARSEVGEALDNYGQGELNPQAVYDLGLAADHTEAEDLSCPAQTCAASRPLRGLSRQ